MPRLHGQGAGHDACAAQLSRRPATRPIPNRFALRSISRVPRRAGQKALKSGDIVNIDVTVIKDGYHGDTSRMFYVGEPSIQARRLVEVTYECMWLGIQAVRPGAYLGDIGHAIQTPRGRARVQRRARVLRPWHRPAIP